MKNWPSKQHWYCLHRPAWVALTLHFGVREKQHKQHKSWRELHPWPEIDSASRKTRALLNYFATGFVHYCDCQAYSSLGENLCRLRLLRHRDGVKIYRVNMELIFFSPDRLARWLATSRLIRSARDSYVIQPAGNYRICRLRSTTGIDRQTAWMNEIKR